MSAFSDAANGKKGKKRARGFEGDDVFKVGPDLLCKNLKDSEMILAILDGKISVCMYDLFYSF